MAHNKAQRSETAAELMEEEKELQEAEAIEAKEEQELAEVKALVDELKLDNQKEMLQRQQRRVGYFVMAKEEQEHAKDTHGHDSWHLRLLHLLHHHYFQAFLVALLLIDVIVVIVELFLEAQYPDCTIIRRDAVCCCPLNSSLTDRRLGGGLTCPDDQNAPVGSIPATCDTHKYPALHSMHYVLVSASVFIMFIFLIELLLLFLCLRSAFCRNFLYCADFFIISTSLILEFVLFHLQEQALISIMLFARFWRFVRIAHGLGTSVHEPMHHKIKHVQSLCDRLSGHLESLVAANKKLENTIESLRAHIQAQEARLQRFQDVDHEEARSKQVPTDSHVTTCPASYARRVGSIAL